MSRLAKEKKQPIKFCKAYPFLKIPEWFFLILIQTQDITFKSRIFQIFIIYFEIIDQPAFYRKIYCFRRYQSWPNKAKGVKWEGTGARGPRFQFCSQSR